MNFHVVVSKNGGGPPKSSISIGFSMIFTIHFGVPLVLETPILLLAIVFSNDFVLDSLTIPATRIPRV